MAVVVETVRQDSVKYLSEEGKKRLLVKLSFSSSF